MHRRLNLGNAIGALALILALAGTTRSIWAQEPPGRSAEPATKKGLDHSLIQDVVPAHTGEGAATNAAHGTEEHGSGEEMINPLKPEPTLTIWTLIVFVGLLFVLGKYAWNPLLGALQKRESHLERVLQDTERARNESEGLLAEHRKQMARAADEVRALLDKARQDAQSAADQIVRQAQEEAESARQRAQRDIASARDQALSEIWQKSADLAVSVAGRVLAKQLNADDHRRLLDAAIKELPAAGADGHGGHAA